MKLRYVMYLDLIFCQTEQISSSFRAQDSVSVLSIDNATQRRSANKKIVYSEGTLLYVNYGSQ